MTRIVFMGTPDFAVPVLAALAEHYEIVAVYTRPDKPAGRGKEIGESPVKTLARERGLTVEQPRTLRSDQALAHLGRYEPDLIVVAAYGLILPQTLLNIPPQGSINTHASLLPRWRGASPITAAILNGDHQTGITLMQMDAGVDTGPIITARRIGIARDDTTKTLGDKLSRLASGLLLETLPAWLEGKITPVPQTGDASFTGLVTKEEGLVDWSKSAVEIERAVRAYNPWPSAYTYWRHPGSVRGEAEKRLLLKIWQAEVADTPVTVAPGTVVAADREIGVATGAGLLTLREVQLAGKRKMSIEEFVIGQRGFVGTRLGES